MSSTLKQVTDARVPRCQKCDRALESALCCSACNLLFAPEGCNAFEVFGLPVGYDIDEAALREIYLSLSRLTHPDRFAAAEPHQQQLALRVSARLNEAYLALHDPVARAEYLLLVCGGKTATEDKTVPQEILTGTLMLREAIDEAKADDDRAALDALRAQIESRHAGLLGEIGELARALSAGDDTRSTLRVKLNSIKYYQRMLEQFGS